MTRAERLAAGPTGKTRPLPQSATSAALAGQGSCGRLHSIRPGAIPAVPSTATATRRAAALGGQDQRAGAGCDAHSSAQPPTVAAGGIAAANTPNRRPDCSSTRSRRPRIGYVASSPMISILGGGQPILQPMIRTSRTARLLHQPSRSNPSQRRSPVAKATQAIPEANPHQLPSGWQ
jgi:hypothetical protein